MSKKVNNSMNKAIKEKANMYTKNVLKTKKPLYSAFW